MGFVPLHRDLFDEAWAVEIRERCLKAFSKLDEIEVIAPSEDLIKNGLVRDRGDAIKVIRLFENADVAGIIIGTMTFGNEMAGLKVAEAFTDRPLLVFGTKEGPFTPEGGRRSDSFCGTLSLTSGLYRRGIDFEFAGIAFPEEESFLNKVREFARVCYIVNEFRGARIALVGPRPETFETCTFNEMALVNNFGQEVVHVSLAEVIEGVQKLSDEDEEVRKTVEEIKRITEHSDVSEDSLKRIAKLEVVLRRLANDKNVSVMAFKCWPEIEEILGIVPCFVLGRLTDSGLITACESDVYGALSMLIQYLASMKSIPPHFIDWTIKHQSKENTFLAWHCGNAPPSLVKGGERIKLTKHMLWEKVLGGDKSQGTGEFQLKPGVVTICRLAEEDGGFKMLITKGRIVESSDKLRGSWSWVEVPDLDHLYETLVKEGFTHHASLIHGDYVEVLKKACRFLGIEVIEV